MVKIAKPNGKCCSAEFLTVLFYEIFHGCSSEAAIPTVGSVKTYLSGNRQEMMADGHKKLTVY